MYRVGMTFCLFLLAANAAVWSDDPLTLHDLELLKKARVEEQKILEMARESGIQSDSESERSFTVKLQKAGYSQAAIDRLKVILAASLTRENDKLKEEKRQIQRERDDYRQKYRELKEQWDTQEQRLRQEFHEKYRGIREQGDGTEDSRGFLVFEAGVDFKSKYFFRGILREDEGLIFQPYIYLTALLCDGDIFDLRANVGTWNSFHDIDGDEQLEDPKMWYESAFNASLNLEILDIFDFGASYAVRTSPNDSFGTFEEIMLQLLIDDSKWLPEHFSLSPGVLLTIEIDGNADGGGSEGIYLQLFIEPKYRIELQRDWEIAISLPVAVGISVDGDYYEDPDGSGDDDFLGYIDIGIAAGVPLPFIPTRYGEWQAAASFHVNFLGNDAVQNFNDGDDVDYYATFGLNIVY